MGQKLQVDRDKIRELYQAGQSLNQIAITLGVHKSNVQYHCRDITRYVEKISNDVVDTIRRLRTERNSTKSIAIIVKLSVPTVKRYYTKEHSRLVKFSHNERLKNIKQQCVDYLGGKCCKCGYNKSLNSLHFHHLDPSTKEFGLSASSSKTFKSKKRELDKCILVCANCHGEIHEREGYPNGKQKVVIT